MSLLFCLSPVSCSSPASQHLSPQRPSLSPDRLLPTASPPLSQSDGPASYSHQPTSSRLRAKFQGRRSYSEVMPATLSLYPLVYNISESFNLFTCFPGIRPVSHPETPRTPDEGPSVHPAQAQAPAGGDAGVRPVHGPAPGLLGGSGQTRLRSRSRRGERRGRGESRGQQPEQQPSSLRSGPGLPSGCRGERQSVV